MKTSPAGLNLIKSFEGCKLTIYTDAAGHPTIGVGHLIVAGEDFTAGITEAQAMGILAVDVAGAEAAVNGAAHVHLRQGQFDALVSFTFNLGLRHSVFDRLNAGDEMAAVDKMLEYRMAAGKPLKGLLRRRCAEAAMFLS